MGCGPKLIRVEHLRPAKTSAAQVGKRKKTGSTPCLSRSALGPCDRPPLLHTCINALRLSPQAGHSHAHAHEHSEAQNIVPQGVPRAPGPKPKLHNRIALLRHSAHLRRGIRQRSHLVKSGALQSSELRRVLLHRNARSCQVSTTISRRADHASTHIAIPRTAWTFLLVLGVVGSSGTQWCRARASTIATRSESKSRTPT